MKKKAGHNFLLLSLFFIVFARVLVADGVLWVCILTNVVSGSGMLPCLMGSYRPGNGVAAIVTLPLPVVFVITSTSMCSLLHGVTVAWKL